MKDLGSASEILGLKIGKDLYTGTIKISQEKYIKELLKRFSMLNCKPSSTPLIPGLKLTCENKQLTSYEKREKEGIPYRELGSLMIN